MTVALSVTIFAFLSYIGIRLKETGIRAAEMKSFYVADAGINKALWYLGTTTGAGGRGLTWRVTSTYEAFGRGGFYLTVLDSATNEVMIISTGEVNGIRKTVSQVITSGGLPSAFDYALYSGGNLSMPGISNIKGDLYVNGNSTFNGIVTCSNGKLYHPTGTSVGGSGLYTYTEGGQPNPIPGFPVLDTSYYDGLITTAQGQSAGNVTYNNATVNLGGANVYVNGNVTISGNSTINGPGSIVASGKIYISGNTYSSDIVKFIAQGTATIDGNAYTNGATYYSNSSLTANGNTRVNVGGFISKGNVKLNGNMTLQGIVYSGGTLTMLGNSAIKGTCVASATGGLTGNANLTYDRSVFPAVMPAGFTGTTLIIKRGSWRGW